MGTRKRGSVDTDVVAYRRVSKNEQAVDWKTSLADQTRLILELAARLGRFLLEEFFFEDRFSGEDAESRPGFMALVAYCRTHPRPKSAPGSALFLNDSRFGRFRDPDEAAYWRFELAKVGWTVRFVENDDTENPTTRHVMRSVGGAQASEYLANLKKNARRGARGAAEKGLWQNEAPFGYRRLATAPGREPVVLEVGQRKSDDQQVRLTPDPDEAKLLVWMFETYASGLASLGDLVRTLREKAPRLKWSKAHLGKMLANRTYLGEVIWCRRPHDKHERRERPVRPPSEWAVKRDAHPPLVSRDLFDRVQARLAKNRRQTRATQGGYPLSGLIRCAHCGEPYIGGGGRINYKDPGDPDRYRFYVDRGGKADPPVCPGRMGTISKRYVEPLVIGEVARVVGAPEVQALIREEIDRYLAEVHGGADAEVASLTKEKQRLLAERGNLAGAIARGVLSDEEAAGEMARIRTALERVEGQLHRLRALASATAEIKRERERLVALAANFGERAKVLAGPALRELLAPWIEDAVLDKQTRVLSLMIRRVPVPATIPAGPVANPNLPSRGVRTTLKIPSVERDAASGHWQSPMLKRRLGR